MLRHKGMLAGLLTVLALLLVSFAHADDNYDSHARIVRLSYIEGQVQVSHRNGIGYESATMNVPVVEGDLIRTTDNGWAEIQFEDGSTVRIAPDSQVTFSALGRFSGGGTITEVNLDDGEAEFKLAAHDDSMFRVNVRQRVIELKHSGRFRVTTTNSDPLELVVWKGEVAVLDSDDAQEVAVKKNETFVIDPMDLGHYDLERTAEADDLDHWVAQREDYLSSYAANARNYSQSPYLYGVNDLNYYGSYYDIPGYGYCLRPYGVNLGWDPFMNGYWSYSPGFGYVWVSAYPWGWMPYRYGRWVFVGGYGWMWQPGLWNTWTPGPRFVNPPAGFRPPVPPVNRVSNPVPFDGGPAKLTVQKPGQRFEGGPERKTVDNRVQNYDGGPARLTVNNPALTTTTDTKNKPVISNEHTPARRVGDDNNVTSPAKKSENPPPNSEVPNRQIPLPAVRDHGDRHSGPAMTTQTANPSPSGPVQNHVVNTPAPPARTVSPPPAPVHVSPPPQAISRPSPPPAPAVHSSSPPPAASTHSDNSGGGRPKR